VGLISSSGGLVYHLRARKFQRSLWQPFTQQVSIWLKEWAPPNQEIVFIGPSAGYTLDLDFFSRFERIVFYEPDWVARLILKRRLHQALRINSPSRHTLPRIESNCQPFNHHTYLEVLESHPQSAFLFSNVLGQLRLDGHTASSLSVFARDLNSQLAQMPALSWASYHDRLSGPIAPTLAHQTLANLNHRLATRELANLVYSDAVGGELTDHETDQWFQTDRARYAAWQLRPNWTHLIEWVQKPT
jgi:hypothetical protein